jgi:hypothetical protein
MASAPPSHSEGVGAGTAADSPITHIVDNLPDGEMALDVPAKMQQGVPRIVTTRIAFKAIGDRLRDDLPQANPTESIKVAEVMKVVLTAKEKDDFLITDKSEATQVIVGKPYAEWSWEVTPLKSGKHALHLNASAMLRDEGQRTPFVVPTKDKDIEVQVSYKLVAGQLINKYWSLLFGGVSLVGVLTGARKAYAQWKGRGGTAQPTS